MKTASILSDNAYVPAGYTTKAVDFMQKILTPINVGATTNGSLRVEGVERGRATWREIGAVIKKAHGGGDGWRVCGEYDQASGAGNEK